MLHKYNYFKFVKFFKNFKKRKNDNEVKDNSRLISVLDKDWYLFKYEDLLVSNVDPVNHWLNFGYLENRSPNKFFDPLMYYAMNPDVEKSGIPAIIHYLSFGYKEGRLPCNKFRVLPETSVDSELSPLEIFIAEPENRFCQEQKTLEIIKNELDHIKSFLPQIREFDSANLYEIQKINSAKLTFNAELLNQEFSNLEMSKSLKKADTLLLLPHLVLGGADKFAMLLAATLPKNLNAMGLTTDTNNISAFNWIPENFKLYSFHDAFYAAPLSSKILFIKSIIQAFEIKNVIGINSRLLYLTLQRHGKVIKRNTNIFLTAFCHEYNDKNEKVGLISEFFIDVHTHVKNFISDNHSYPKQLQTEYGFPDSYLTQKFITINTPCDIPDNDQKSLIKSDNNKILWTGRGVNQKNLPLLSQIAKSLPDFEFFVYGSGNFQILEDLSLPNIKIMGSYSHSDVLPFSNFLAFLYTSFWDGKPIVILDAAKNHLPIVASNVGGISELVNSKTGYLCNSVTNPQEYIDALLELKHNPGNAREKTKNMLDHIKQEHNFEKFTSTVANMFN